MISEQRYLYEPSSNQDHHFLKGRFLIPVHYPCNDCVDCGEFFEINLAGLTDSVNFELVKYKDHEVEIETTTCKDNKVSGKIYKVGIDFIELLKDNGRIVTILKDKISQIHWLNEDRPSS